MYASGMQRHENYFLRYVFGSVLMKSKNSFNLVKNGTSKNLQ